MIASNPAQQLDDANHTLSAARLHLTSAQGFECKVLRGARRLLRSGQVRALQLEVSPFHQEKQNCTRAKITNILQNANFTCEFKCTHACGSPDDQRSFGELVAWHNTVPRNVHIATGMKPKYRGGAVKMHPRATARNARSDL
jgi:hypothetical protein